MARETVSAGETNPAAVGPRQRWRWRVCGETNPAAVGRMAALEVEGLYLQCVGMKESRRVPVPQPAGRERQHAADGRGGAAVTQLHTICRSWTTGSWGRAVNGRGSDGQAADSCHTRQGNRDTGQCREDRPEVPWGSISTLLINDDEVLLEKGPIKRCFEIMKFGDIG